MILPLFQFPCDAAGTERSTEEKSEECLRAQPEFCERFSWSWSGGNPPMAGQERGALFCLLFWGMPKE